MRFREWAAFSLLGLVWGSSFLWIKIGVQDVAPVTLAAFRLLFGLIGLLFVMRVQRQPVPRDLKVLSTYLVMGVLQAALPFALISWGETTIESSLAAILNGTLPLFTILIAHFWLHDERISLPRLIGLIVGFSGVVAVVSRELSIGAIHRHVWGQLAVLAASCSYALGATFARRFRRGESPVVQATMVVLTADVVLWLTALTVERPLHLPTVPITWVALVWLGLLGSCLAYLLYFYLINAWGPTRATLVTYVFPVVGLFLGILLLGEVADWHLIVGSLLVVSGIAIVNLKVRVRDPASAEPITN